MKNETRPLKMKNEKGDLKMNKQDAYKIVLNELLKVNMFRGVYDAKNGNEDFMDGILTVMEYIAFGADEKVGAEVTSQFTKNMVESKVRAEFASPELSVQHA